MGPCAPTTATVLPTILCKHHACHSSRSITILFYSLSLPIQKLLIIVNTPVSPFVALYAPPHAAMLVQLRFFDAIMKSIRKLMAGGTESVGFRVEGLIDGEDKIPRVRQLVLGPHRHARVQVRDHRARVPVIEAGPHCRHNVGHVEDLLRVRAPKWV